MIETLPDIPRSATAITEWLSCLVYILVLPRRPGRVGFVVLLAAGLGLLLGLQFVAGKLPLAFWMPGMLTAFALMFALIAATTRMSRLDTGYVAARAFVLAELVASLEWQLHTFYARPGAELWSALSLLMATAFYAVTFGVLHRLERRHFSRDRPPGIGPRTLGVAVAIAVITFALSNLSFLTKDTPFSGTLPAEVFYIRTLVDLCGYIALYAQHEQLRKQRADAELAAMDSILRAQHDQYLQARSSVETANRTWHDLKHQLAVIRAELDPERRAAYLDELDAAVAAYSATFDTGNPVLDAILTTKAGFSSARGITLTCVADGTALGFVQPMDLATILGNALDNATESVLRLKDPDQRLVRVAVARQGACVVMRFENYFDGRLRYEDGELLTRKADKARHGLGLKSVRYTAQKYGGIATVTADDNWFTLTVVLPVPEGPDQQPDLG